MTAARECPTCYYPTRGARCWRCIVGGSGWRVAALLVLMAAAVALGIGLLRVVVGGGEM